MQHFETLSAYLEYLELPPPEHPMFSMNTALHDGFLDCPRKSSPPITNDCYTISFKKFVTGELNYGRTKYDFRNGALFFLSPRQVLQWNEAAVFEQKGFTINFHRDFLIGTELANEMSKFGFFSYSTNEALHLSPKEEKQMELIIENMELEYRNNQDSFSKDLIISHLRTLLKYAQRYYERQFKTREILTNDLLERFNQQLGSYIETGKLDVNGIPSIEDMADLLSVSQRYLSDTLKKETGKTSTEHLQLYLINVAKNRLLDPKKTIAEVAYELGFEYPTYFSRLFKKKEGISPTEYRRNFNMN